MLRKFYLLSTLVLSFILAACAHHQVPVAQVSYRSEQIRPVPAFSRVKVDGRINVSLHTGSSRPQVILRGDSRDLAYVSIMVVNNTLVVNVGKGYPHFGAIQADIRGRYLNSFVYHGAGIIDGSNVRSSLLDLSIANEGRTTLQGQMVLRNLDVSGNGYLQISGITSENLYIKLAGKPRVQLSGVVNLTSLNMDNDGWLSMYWVKSKTLIVRGRGAAFIQLAGVADRLDVELWGKAQFHGRYLRASNAFVKTHNQSLAEIAAVNKQHTLASDNSDIHFFNIPSMKTDFMGFNGAVLNMRDWNMPFMQEYNQYNK